MAYGTKRRVEHEPTIELIGANIEASLSPAMMNDTFTMLEMSPQEWWYARYPFRHIPNRGIRIGSLKGLLNLKSQQGRKGLGITIPYKSDILQTGIVTPGDSIVPITGVTNTLINNRDGTWTGYNTDVVGIKGALMPHLLTVATKPSIVLGAGATATSAVMALGEMGAPEVSVAARRESQAKGLVEKLQPHFPDTRLDSVELDTDQNSQLARRGLYAGLILNTTPMGQTGTQYVGVNPYGGLYLRDKVLMDVVYDPLLTPFLRSGIDDECRLVHGIEMLAHQASEQLALFANEPLIETERLVIARSMLAAGYRERLWRADSRSEWH